MNISFLTPEYPHPKIKRSAGIATSIKNLATSIVNKNHQVYVFVYGQDSSEIINDNGIEIHKIAYKKYSFFSWFLYRKDIQRYINNIIKEKNIQLLEAQDWTGITAFMTFKCPLLIRLHGTDAYFCHLEGRKQKFKNRLFEKLALKSADYITSVSEFTAKTTKRIFHLSKEIKVIHNGIDIQLFKSSEVSNLDTLNEKILYFGSLIRKKGVLELAEIFNEVVKEKPLAQLTLLGTDVIDIFEKTSTLQLFRDNLSVDAKKNVTHIAHIPYNEVKDYIAKANVVVLPSFAEAFPMTWLESMAMKKGLVTSNIGWANELMVDGKTGYIADPKNHKLYASKIVELLDNKNLNTTFGNNARKHIEANFSQELIVSQNINYFETIIYD